MDPGILTQILSKLGLSGSPSPTGGMAQTAPQAGNSASPASPASPPTSLLSKIGTGAETALNNPLIQGAMAGYFQNLAAPRHTSLLGRIGEGGEAALQTYQNAQRQKLMLPLLQAQIQATQGKVPLEAAQTSADQSRAQLDRAKASALGPNPQGGQQLALMAQNPSYSPEQQQMALSLAQGVTEGKIPYDKAAKLIIDNNVAGAKIALLGAQTTTEQQRPGLIGAEANRDAAQGAEATANASLVPARRAELESTTARNQATTAATEATTPAKIEELTASAAEKRAQQKLAEGKLSQEQAALWQKTYADAAKDYLKVHPGMLHMGGATDASLDAYASDKADRVVGAGSGTGTSATASPTLPDGWKPGPPGPDGKPTAYDASGTLHKWED